MNGGTRLTYYNYIIEVKLCTYLPARASEQGNVIGLVSVYIYMSSKKL